MTLVKTTEYQEMVEVPVDNGRLYALESLGGGAVAFGIQPVIACRFDDVISRAAVAAHATGGTDFLQWQPHTVVGKDHRE